MQYCYMVCNDNTLIRLHIMRTHIHITYSFQYNLPQVILWLYTVLLFIALWCIMTCIQHNNVDAINIIITCMQYCYISCNDNTLIRLHVMRTHIHITYSFQYNLPQVILCFINCITVFLIVTYSLYTSQYTRMN